MREIPLSGGRGAGMVALVDDEDYDRIMAVCRRWSLQSRGMKARATVKSAKPTTVYMHRVVMGPGAEIDHINGNGLDNRKENLRFCDRSGNCANRRGWGRSSRFKGVYRQPNQKTGRVWRAGITTKGRFITLGYFATEEEAHAAYCEAAAKHHGEFARAG